MKTRILRVFLKNILTSHWDEVMIFLLASEKILDGLRDQGYYIEKIGEWYK